MGVSVRFEKVTKRFGGRVAVDNFSLAVGKGEFLIFLGPSGCGKTTTLRMLAGLETPTEGEIYIEGVNVKALHPKDRDIAMVFQNYALYPHMTVYGNLSFPLEAKKLPKSEIRKKVTETAKMLGIAEHFSQKPKQLSGGEAQRVALGRAIIREPRVFLMDEPLSNLDAKLRIEMRDELLRLHRAFKITTIYVTHDQEEAMALGDRLAVFNKGLLRQVGTPQEIYNKPKDRFVAEFIGNPKMNILEGVLDRNGSFTPHSDRRQKISIAGKTLPKKAEGPVLLGIRPEDLVASRRPAKGAIKVKIDLVEVMGRDLRVCFALGKDIFTLLAPHSQELTYGEQMFVKVNEAKIHLFDIQTMGRLD